MKKYLLNVTFYAGSDDPEDIDNRLYILSIDKETTEEQMEEIFNNVNKLLDCYNEENNDFPVSYEEGINIDTLMAGIRIYTKGKVSEINNNCGKLNFDNYYEIEQWQ